MAKAKKSKKKAPLTAQQQAQQTQEERDAVQALRDRQYAQHYRTTQENYNMRHFWSYWKNVNDSAPAPDPNLKIGSAPDADTRLGPGTYARQGGNPSLNVFTSPPVYAYFGYDKDEKKFTLTIDVRQYAGLTKVPGDPILRRDYKKWEPVTEKDYEKHAQITGKESVRFFADAGLPKIVFTFAEDHPFGSADQGYSGKQRLHYAEEQIKTAVYEALLSGIELEVSQNFLQAVGDKRGNLVQAKLVAEIKKTKANNEQHEMLNKFVNVKALQDLTAKLQNTDSISQADRDAFKKKVDEELKDLKYKIDTLKTRIGSEPDAGVKAKLQAEHDALDARHTGLQMEEKKLKAAADDTTKTATKDDLQALQDRLEAVVDPQKQFKDAVGELKSTLAGITDKSAYTDPEKKQLDAFQIKLDDLEKRLATPSGPVERGKVDAELKQVMQDMKDLAASKPDFKQKCEASIDKAEKLAKGEKASLTSAQNIEDRVTNVEKAAAELKRALEEYKNAKASDLEPRKDANGNIIGEGMIIGRKPVTERRAWASRFIRIEEGQGQQYIDKRFDDLKTQRDTLRQLIDAERKQLGIDKDKLSDTEKLKVSNRLAVVEQQLTGPKDSGSVDDLQNKINDAKATRALKP